ncbi:VIT domain-containing protein [Allonocardiopsis opalescens]|uniref:Ca-activated chloride channel family protein n=1 Tax=Allonocardiopsis opalescens TaxID=1144618 RepID=A0A2T0Q4G6_9ACTN|nr:VIT domain-containing protein [Allonocardiopsis opalescens]PRX98653.1 Ca-activated chloride channel family protein [Allonocardiopsis opalescens]
MTLRIHPLSTERAAAPLPDAGLGALRTEAGNLPLDSVDVRARLTLAGLTAGVEVRQTFRNPHDRTLEAAYVFPLPDRAAVTALRMRTGGRVVDGRLAEREEARRAYTAALDEGRTASIAEEDRPDVFNLRVGNIAPGASVTVDLSLSQPLGYADDAAEFRFPLVVAPRYIPGAPIDGPAAGEGTAPDTDAVPDASRITPPVLLPGFPSPVRLSLSVEIEPGAAPPREVQSSLHELLSGETDESTGLSVLRLRPDERLNRDFVLRLVLAEADRPATSAVLVPDGDRPAGAEGPEGEGTFALTVLPPAESAAGRRPRAVVLLLDRSGSMRGWKMVAARRAAARIVDTLSAADRFAVLAFDHAVERPPALPEGLVPGGDRERFRAVEHLARLEARGGTQIAAPLGEAVRLLAAAPDDGADRVLVVVTDGQVGNEDQVLDRFGAELRRLRVHTVGIDRAVNNGFLGRLAALGAGRSELVESEDRLDAVMERIHRRIGAPLVTDLELTAEGLEQVPGTLAPEPVGALFPGVPVTVRGRWRGAPPDGSRVRLGLRGTAADGSPWRADAVAAVSDAPSAAAVWARAHLRDLEDRYTIGSSGRGAPVDLGELERRIVRTSLGSGVLCRFTAFVAVDPEVTAEGGPEHRVVQPVELPEGWEAPGMLLAGPAPAAGAGGTARMALRAGMERAEAHSDKLDLPDFLAAGPPEPGAARQRAVPRAKGFGAAAPGRARPAPAPVGYGGPAPAGPGLLALIGEEAERLRTARPAGERERAEMLADLGTRLRTLLSDRTTVAGPVRDRLEPLLAELERCDGPERPAGAALVELWERTVRLLSELAQGAGPAPEPEGPREGGGPRRPFWKRG